MSGWTALVPLKSGGGRKSRLADRLNDDERERLAMRMFGQVIAALRGCADVDSIAVLSETEPPLPGLAWAHDAGLGLNPALEAARPGRPFLVINADLPLATSDDIAALIAAARGGGAIAPDRHGEGTNALALDRLDLAFRFGAGSFERHVAQAPGVLAVVERPGLALDVDMKEDLAEACHRGFRME